MKPLKVFILESDSSLRLGLARLFDRNNWQVVTASSIQQALSIIPLGHKLDLLVSSSEVPAQSLQNLCSKSAQVEKVILLSNDLLAAIPELPSASFVQRLDTPEEIFKKCLQLFKPQAQALPANPIVGESAEILEIHDLINHVSDSDSTVLIAGASGTGKELVARQIHQKSQRSKGQFVAVNCGAIPHDLIESELFGHVKGAFTGAIQNRVGRFEFADQGTIFLDEIGELPPSMQVKLLRVLQERSFEPIGSTKSIHVDVRVIAASNRNLEQMVAHGKFREDLYYRLNVIPLNLPSLKERRSDIPLLIQHFLRKNRKQESLNFLPQTLNMLMTYAWPGNVRELENLVERICVLKKQGPVDISDLPLKYREFEPEPMGLILPEGPMDFNSAVDQFENQLILRALEKTGWNRNQAAALLRLNRTTLVEKIKKKGLKPQFEEVIEGL